MRKIGILLALVILSGCASRHYKAEENSGFLNNYSQLEQIETPSGSNVWRWISPDIKNKKYTGVYIEPLIFFPEPKAQDQVSKEVLEQIRSEMEQRVYNVANYLNLPVKTEKTSDTLVLRSAITSLSVKLQDLQIREIIPVRLVISGAQLAMGWRDKNVVFLLESEVTDGQSGQPMATSVRKIKTQPLNDNTQKLSLEHTQTVMNQLEQDLKTDFANLKTLIQSKK